jgi:hypothetical protein
MQIFYRRWGRFGKNGCFVVLFRRAENICVYAFILFLACYDDGMKK